MVNDVNSIVRAEILQDRHDDGSVSDGCQINSHPVSVVFTHYGNLIILLDTALLEEDMQFFNVDSQLAVSQCYICPVIGDSRQVPVFPERALEHFDKIVFFFGHHNESRFIGLAI